ncbi:hypothetical protein [Vibrio sp. D431a]|uniref:hypothetical protein n=1 Tax=Vibrio sp. D431a TaxID=2837388 RepID=UPI0025554F6D|nr:hypothetical protein [Vibrio sp. D431a]MDK9790611.1 hypothetical protein [Vibrio sp. D431a]
MQKSEKKFFDHDDIDGFLHFAVSYANQLGLQITKIIGSGKFGVAFLTNRCTVLKVTTDDSEVECARSVLGKKVQYLARVYDVVSMGGLSAIHLELVNELTRSDVTTFDLVVDKLVDSYKSGDAVTAEVILSFSSSLGQKGGDGMFNDLSNGIKELSEAGGKPIDIRTRNIGYIRGNYVLFDQKFV